MKRLLSADPSASCRLKGLKVMLWCDQFRAGYNAFVQTMQWTVVRGGSDPMLVASSGKARLDVTLQASPYDYIKIVDTGSHLATGLRGANRAVTQRCHWRDLAADDERLLI